MCANYVCIDVSLRCDSVIDCEDGGSDEHNCRAYCPLCRLCLSSQCCVYTVAVVSWQVRDVCDLPYDVVVTSDGHVSAYHDGAFYPVCADSWSPVWSAGVCRDLGAGAVLLMSTVAVQRSVYLTVVNSSVYNITHLRLSTACNTGAGVRLLCRDASCGLSSTAVQPFIVGGEIAADNAWPWAAALLYKGSYQCTASVIGSGWLVTAAHCFFSVNTAQRLSNVPQYFAVRLASVLSRGYSRHLRVASVKRVIVHPNYTVDAWTNMRYNDVALVQLGDDLLTPTTTSSSSSSSQLCLADNEHHSLTTLKTWQCFVIGWGLSNADGYTSESGSLFLIYYAAITKMRRHAMYPVVCSSVCRPRPLNCQTHTKTGLLLCGSHKAGLNNCKQTQIHANIQTGTRRYV